METPPAADSTEKTAAYYPELVFCLCAALGTDTGVVSDALASELSGVGYTPVPIRLSALMAQIPGLERLSGLREEDDRIRQGMTAGNEIRRIIGHPDAVVRLALTRIFPVRASLNRSQDETVPAERHCFIITSLKRAEEWETVRRLFGERALLVSVYESRDQRVENLCRKIASSKNSSDPDIHKDVAEGLIDTDQKEPSNEFGQRLAGCLPARRCVLKGRALITRGCASIHPIAFSSTVHHADSGRNSDVPSSGNGEEIARPVTTGRRRHRDKNGEHSSYRLQRGASGWRWRNLGRRCR